jgi:hypothetical protein
MPYEFLGREAITVIYNVRQLLWTLIDDLYRGLHSERRHMRNNYDDTEVRAG